MRFRIAAATLLALLFSASAMARIGTLDEVPAATLLFPNFEVSDQDNGVNTILSIQNASATAMLLNVTVWTDLGLPTAHFNIYLTGYDQETVDMRDVFRRYSPVTASAGQDPQDLLSPHGPISQDINFASCSGTLPNGQASSISRGIYAAHTGGASIDYFGGLCGSRVHTDGIARGYVTVDTVNACNTLTPASTNFFTYYVTNQNTMLGEYLILDPSRRAFANKAVHIEASATDPLTSAGANKQTFYARFVGYNAQDNREPLPTAWAARYASARTQVDVWRDPGVPIAPFTCGSLPAALPTGQRHVSVFNDAGGVVSNPGGNLFPFVSGRTDGAGALGLTQPLGWLFANLNLGAPVGPLGAVRQSWMSFRQIPRAMTSTGPAAYMVPGIQLGNAATGGDPILP